MSGEDATRLLLIGLLPIACAVSIFSVDGVALPRSGYHLAGALFAQMGLNTRLICRYPAAHSRLALPNYANLSGTLQSEHVL